MLLGCQYPVWIPFVGLVLVLAKPPTNLPRQYRIQRQYISLLNNGGFSITDLAEKEIYYKIERRFYFGQRIDMFRYPEKKKTARLRSTFHLLGLYRAKFSILNETTNRWVSGKIKQTREWRQHSYKIQWNGQDLKLNATQEYRTFEFRDKNNEMLANYFIHHNPRFRRTFNMTIYSNNYPEELYFLGLAAHATVLLWGKSPYQR